MDRRPVVGGNWKMNTTLDEARSLARSLMEEIGHPGGAEVIVCPPFTNLQAVHEIIAGSVVTLGAQDLFWEPKGAYTGEISAEMLASLGVAWVICGHSERRHILGESNEVVNRKVRRALGSGLRVILAVGETEPERVAGQTEAVLAAQLAGSLSDVSSQDLPRMVVAYEPVWAIGTGLTATPDQAQDAHAFVRGWLRDLYATEAADSIRLQYGGSVTAANASALMNMPDIDGALVGGASLKASDFAAIVRAAGESAR